MCGFGGKQQIQIHRNTFTSYGAFWVLFLLLLLRIVLNSPSHHRRDNSGLTTVHQNAVVANPGVSVSPAGTGWTYVFGTEQGDRAKHSGAGEQSRRRNNDQCMLGYVQSCSQLDCSDDAATCCMYHHPTLSSSLKPAHDFLHRGRV
jgi:hypothetical protein